MSRYHILGDDIVWITISKQLEGFGQWHLKRKIVLKYMNTFLILYSMKKTPWIGNLL